MVPIWVQGQDMEKPKVVTDYNSGMRGVDLSGAHLTCCHKTRKRPKKYYQKHFSHFTGICCLNSYLLTKNQG